MLPEQRAGGGVERASTGANERYPAQEERKKYIVLNMKEKIFAFRVGFNKNIFIQITFSSGIKQILENLF